MKVLSPGFPPAALFASVVLAAGVAAASPCPTFQFLPPADVLSLPGNDSTVRIADFTGDGRADVFVLAPGSAAHVEVRQPDGTYLAAPASVTSAAAFAIADVDGDGRPDAVLFDPEGPRLARVGADGSLRVDAPSPGLPQPVARTSAFADLDHDGGAELVAAVDGTLWRYRWSEPGGFVASQLVALTGPALLLAAGDFDGDGNADVIIVGPEDYPAYRRLSRLLPGDGRGGLREGPTFNFPSINSLVVADFNRDGRMDFAYQGHFSAQHFRDAHGLCRGDPVAGFLWGSDISPAGSATDTLLTADFDGDRNPDLGIAGDQWTGTELGDGAGLFTTSAELRVGTGWRPTEATDVDGDGRPDLAGVLFGHLLVARNTCPARPADRWIPAVLSIAGENGARFETEVTLDNPRYTGETLSVEIRYVPSRGGGGGGEPVRLTIPAGGQRVLRPALDELAALGLQVPPSGDRAGMLALRVVGGTERFLLVTARVTSPTSTGGHAGVNFTDVRRGSGLSAETVVGWLRETGTDRSNVALLNLGEDADGDIALRLTVVVTDPFPKTVVLPDVRVAPGRFVQLDRILRLAEGRGGFVRVTRVEGTAPFHAYGVVNDNGTGDGSFVAGFETSRPASTRYTVPSVVESGRYATDLVVTNATAQARTVSFRFVSETLSTPDRTARFAIDVSAEDQLFVPDLVEMLRARGVDGVGPRGGEYAGALFAEVSGSPTSGVYIGARVTASKPEGGYGVFFEAVREEELKRPDVVCAVGAVRQDSSARTNVAVVNAGNDPAQVSIQVAGRSRAFTLGPGRWAQVDSVLSALGTGLTGGQVVVFAEGSRVPFLLAYGVTNDGAIPGAASDDASFLPCR